MRALIQRVQKAKVSVRDSSLVKDGEEVVVGEIGQGILTLLGVGKEDTEEELQKLISKILKLRIFEDDQGKMNRSLLDIGGEHLIVSQFTLYADTSQGNRPSFKDAGHPEEAKRLYEKSLEISRSLGVRTQGGKFQADMQVHLVNDGPVTLWLSSGKESS